MAPEQVRGEEVGREADIYALGAVLYTALSGRVPFHRADTAARLWATVNEPVPTLSGGGSNLPPTLDEVLAKATAKERGQRYATAGAFVAAATDALAAAPPALDMEGTAVPQPAPPSTLRPEPVATAEPVCPPAPDRTSVRHLRRRFAVSAGAVAAVIALVAIGLFATQGNGKTRRTGGSAPIVGAQPATTGSGRTMTFQLAGTSVPVVTKVPDQPIASMASSIAGITLQLYVVQRAQPGAVLVVSALKVDPSAASIGTETNVEEGLSFNLATAGAFGHTVSGVALLDPAGLKEYETFMADPAKDTTCLCSVLGGQNFDSEQQTVTNYEAALVAAPPCGCHHGVVRQRHGVLRQRCAGPMTDRPRRWRSRPRRAAAIGAALAAASPAGASSVPTPGTPRVVTLQPRIVSLQPRITSIAPTQPAPDTFNVGSDILFAFNVATLSPDSQAVLGDVVSTLKSSGAGTVTINGYTDSVGTDSYNQTLSQNRAASVQAFLQANVGNGALAYQAQGLGKADPVAPNTNPDGSDNPGGRQQNRRVVIAYTGG